MLVDTIVTDLDDTLLNEAGEISDFSLAVLRRCMERGIRLIPASGRAQASMEPYVRRLNTGLPYIACNGGQLVNADHSLMESLTLTVAEAREVCAFFLEHGMYTQVYLEDMIFYSRECEASRLYRASTRMKGRAVGDLLSFVTFPTTKVLCIGEPERIAELYPRIEALLKGRMNVTVSKPVYLEATPLGGTKGEALGRLAKRMAIEPARTIVFGDSLNDLSMLAFTENSVAVGNAREEVRAAARYVCGGNHEDGMARFIQEHILGG